MVGLAQQALKQIAPGETHWDGAGGQSAVSGQATCKAVNLQHRLPSTDTSRSSLTLRERTEAGLHLPHLKLI